MPGANGTAIRVARPTLALNRQDNQALSAGLLSLLIVEDTSGLYRLEASFGNWGNVSSRVDFLYFDRRTLDFGKAIQVKLGDDLLFNGRITGLEAQFPEGRPPALTILAEDRLQDLRMTRRTRTFTEIADGDIIRQIAADHGLTPTVDVSGPTHAVVAQVNQSDLAFVRERARSVDAELWVDDSTLYAKTHAQRNGGSLNMTYAQTLREFSALADVAGQRTSVFVNGWDVAGKAGLQYEATDAAISSELNNDTSGVSILSSAFGQRKEALAHVVPLTSQEAQGCAEAYFRMAARRFVVGRGVTETDRRLRVGAYVNLDGLGKLFNGRYYLVEVRHVFDDARGLRSEFTAERPGLGQP